MHVINLWLYWEDDVKSVNLGKPRPVDTLTTLNAHNLIKLLWGVQKSILTDRNLNFLELYMDSGWHECWPKWEVTEEVCSEGFECDVFQKLWSEWDRCGQHYCQFTGTLKAPSEKESTGTLLILWASSCSGEISRGLSSLRLRLFYIRFPLGV